MDGMTAETADRKLTIDMTHVLLDERGQPAKDSMARDPNDAATEEPLTLGHAVKHALLMVYPGDAFPEERQVSGETKYARAVLAYRVKDDPAAVLSTAETALVKRLLGYLYGGVILMQAYPLIAPNDPVPAIR